jgi:16S rRNA (guanine966-N2)-methyltransferase
LALALIVKIPKNGGIRKGWKDIVMILNSGSLKGLKIKVCDGIQTRPTLAKTRESLINMIQNEVVDAYFVDLFAGSGAVGLAALSRGAKSCVFVENDREAFKALQSNIDSANKRFLKQSVKVDDLVALQKNVGHCWAEIRRFGQPNIIWADPPYSLTTEWLARSSKDVWQNLAEGGLFALEMNLADQNLVEMADNCWELIKSRKFGSTLICIWQKLESKS